jgi:hypothetical protein
MTDTYKNLMDSTYKNLMDALRVAIDMSPKRHELADALRAYATSRGRYNYDRLRLKAPIIRDLLDAIEESSDARLFAEETD